MKEAFIYDAIRTPRGVGKASGSLSSLPPIQLISNILQHLKMRAPGGIDAAEDVILGVVDPIAEQGGDIARIAVLDAGLAETTAGVQINRFCASGLEAVNMAAAKVMAGQSELVIAGGVESMSRIPMLSSGGAWSIDPSVAIPNYFIPQGVAADLIATKYHFGREALDRYACQSQARAQNAWDAGYFTKSVVPVMDRFGQPVLAKDEHMRPGTTLEDLQKLKPSFAELGQRFGFDAVAMQRYPEEAEIIHSHTAGNSSGVVDGAAGVLIGDKKTGAKLGLKPRAKIRAFKSIGSEPCIMLTAPSVVSKLVLKHAGMKPTDIDLYEINEAFAAVVLLYLQEMALDDAKVNVNGGAIAMGHPLGATGAMILGTVLDELERRDCATGLVTLCVGAGMGTATIIERV